MSVEMDDGYFQVDRQIVNSSVWVGTDSDTKVLWLFLMFSANIRSGIVSHTIPALSRDTGISRDTVEKILDSFCSPDPDSRSSEFEGRRIEYIEEGNKNGGICILNYRKYKEKNRSLSTQRVRNFRKRNETDETDETFQTVSGTKEKEKENKKEIKKEKYKERKSLVDIESEFSSRMQIPIQTIADCRDGCSMARKTGKISDTVWERFLRKLSRHKSKAVLEAMTLFVDKYADGDHNENYLLGIVRGREKPKRAVQTKTRFDEPGETPYFPSGGLDGS